MIHWLRAHGTLPRPLHSISQPRRGQATIMFALMMVPMIGMLGLVVDGGFYLYAQRTTQAAADAAALAGARLLSQSKPAQAEVGAVVAANGQGALVPSSQECRYVNDSNALLPGATCGDPPPGASGVLVRTTATVPTFFISVIPGAPTSSVTATSAIARVQVASGIKADGPFIVCGYDSWDVTDDLDTTNGGENRSILLDDNPMQINPEAIGQTFRIWDPRLVQEGAGCEAGRQFKGLADSEANQNLPVPGLLEIDNGVQAGPTRSDVNGLGGCDAGTSDLDGCVLILPLATSEGGGAGEVYGVGFAAFRMSLVDSNSYNGTLIGAYIIDAAGSDGWTPDSGGIISIRMTG